MAESDWVQEYEEGHAMGRLKGTRVPDNASDDYERGFRQARAGLDCTPVRGRECGLCSRPMSDSGCSACDRVLWGDMG